MKILDDNRVSKISSTTTTERTQEGGKSSTAKGVKTNSKKNKNNVERKNISENEIREKLAANVEMSNTAKQQIASKNTQQFGNGFMNAEFKAPTPIEKPALAESANEKSDDPNTPDHIVKSDVGKNAPQDPTTTEKLKAVLQKGAFNFNPKEREALDRILADR